MLLTLFRASGTKQWRQDVSRLHRIEFKSNRIDRAIYYIIFESVIADLTGAKISVNSRHRTISSIVVVRAPFAVSAISDPRSFFY